MTKKGYKIIETNYALASVYPTSESESIIEIHHLLLGDLRTKMLNHERRHKSLDRHYTSEDLKNDFQSENSYFMDSLKFSVIHPECLINFMPYMYSYYAKEWTQNKGAFIPFGYFGIIFSLVVSSFLSWIFKTSFLSLLWKSAMAYLIFFALMNGLLLLMTHILVKKDKGFVYKEVTA